MKTNFVVSFTLIATVLSALNAPLSIGFAQGALAPPGAPAPVMKSLDQIEPRTPISGQLILNNPGSYYFTTNVTANGGYGIIIQTDNVSIDLAGFTLSGGAGASSDGILVNGTYTNLAVYNGTIRNWGSVGIDASQSTGSRFESLKIFKNNGAGLLAGNLSQVRGSSVSANNGDGISLGMDSTAVEISAVGNNGRGIAVRDDCSIKNSTASANTNGGIYAGLNCLIFQCVVFNNSNSILTSVGTGIIVSNNSSVVECLANYNSGSGIVLGMDCTVRGCTVIHNPGNAITTMDNCRIVDNNCVANGSGILVFGAGSRIDGNNSNSNQFDGIQIANAAGNLVIRNKAQGNVQKDFNYPGLNFVGPIISTNSGVDPGTSIITNSNPWANFSF